MAPFVFLSSIFDCFVLFSVTKFLFFLGNWNWDRREGENDKQFQSKSDVQIFMRPHQLIPNHCSSWIMQWMSIWTPPHHQFKQQISDIAFSRNLSATFLPWNVLWYVILMSFLYSIFFGFYYSFLLLYVVISICS